MNISCIVCGNETKQLVVQGGHSFFVCVFCKLVLVNPLPTDDELKKVYSPLENYQSHKVHKDYTKVNNPKYDQIISELQKLIPGNSKVLDVGASDGDFLYFVKKAGFEVAGVEPNETTAKIANSHELNVFNGFLSESNFAKNFFSALRLGDVLEHSNNPNQLLSECSSFLVPGGLLVISIPNMDSNWARSTRLFTKLFKLPWSVLTPPHHLFYFSKNNLDMIFSNHNFSFVKAWYHRPPTFKYEFGNTHLFGKWKRNKTILNSFKLALGLGVYGSLYLFDIVATPFKKKDFGMVCIYKKNA